MTPALTLEYHVTWLIMVCVLRAFNAWGRAVELPSYTIRRHDWRWHRHLHPYPWGVGEVWVPLPLRVYSHLHVYDVSLLERVGVDIKLPTIFHLVGWKKLYKAPRSGLCLLTIEFLTTSESFTKGRKSYVHFRLFGREFEFDYSRFSKLLDFSSSSLPESRAMKNFSRVEFCDEISGKSTRIRFSDIHKPTLMFLHRWVSFMMFPMRELRSITVSKLKCLYAMVRKIR
jgi:hypothetical protein